MFVDGWDDWNLIRYRQVEAAKVEGFRLFWVVGQQSNAAQTQVLQDLDSHSVVAHIGFKSQRMVGFHGVHALFLQSVGAYFLS